jgi:hypothetical protein
MNPQEVTGICGIAGRESARTEKVPFTVIGN